MLPSSPDRSERAVCQVVNANAEPSPGCGNGDGQKREIREDPRGLSRTAEVGQTNAEDKRLPNARGKGFVKAEHPSQFLKGEHIVKAERVPSKLERAVHVPASAGAHSPAEKKYHYLSDPTGPGLGLPRPLPLYITETDRMKTKRKHADDDIENSHDVYGAKKVAREEVNLGTVGHANYPEWNWCCYEQVSQIQSLSFR